MRSMHVYVEGNVLSFYKRCLKIFKYKHSNISTYCQRKIAN